jgi:hypothetical protein
MPQDKAVQLYTGSHWRVEAATLADVEHFTKFAVSSQCLAVPSSGPDRDLSIPEADAPAACFTYVPHFKSQVKV